MSIALIIPVYNEELTIQDTLSVVKEIAWLNEIIVVCDGCTDGSEQIARATGVRVISYSINRGKGAAILAGVEASQAENLIFIDADLIGLKESHIFDLAQPVLKGEADMTVGVFAQGRVSTDLAQVVAPYLSGQRAFTRKAFDMLEGIEDTRYGLEVFLTKQAKALRWRVRHVVLPDLTHIMKEEKLGFFKGFGARMKMYWEIAKCINR